MEAQLIETALLNIINHQSLIATKAARVVYAAQGDGVMEFGLRRAQGPDAGIYGARAAMIAGCIGTSNVLCGKMFDVPVKGTHAHSWIMSFPDELTAFRTYAKLYPSACILLVDTYDTLNSGIPNAIRVFREMKEEGVQLKNYGVRLDSGDLAYLSKKAKKMLDEAGFPDAVISASNDLDEYLIDSLKMQGAAINSWGQFQSKKTAMLAQYVKNFIHPVFKYNGPAGNIEVTPCSLVSGNELAIHMGLPRRSVCGLPVIEHADFGKEIVTYDGTKCSTGINLGKIFNMGSSGNSKVSLNVNSLAMHTFITGSTGSGKSNTVYEIIRQLDNLGIHYMVIEPAKGEYKNVFGMRPDIQVYGTNPQCTDLLRINPFKFPKGIHILEHIDRLIEIFNVCWPMYAAMPAVLKDAVLRAYESCGWDLAESQNRYSNNLFPTFSDLLNELVTVIESSAYSEEVKSNYIGSLVTRIKSLTNGLNGQIFAANEINNCELFDKKVIVDISRVGSIETKSLIMGILIMRLSEHRMSTYNDMNVPLHHVTILEEAHNILKRTSTEQSTEGGNVAGKSVEMLSNAIAEMRTYGEGFIIADQSPSAVDISAIRNTNTKIIMRLPDEQDRRLAGKSAGLRDNQLDEIAKLPKGVAVVYQNDWLEPVLCKIEKFRGEENRYQKDPKNYTSFSRNKSTIVIQNLLSKTAGKKLDMNLSELSALIIGMDIPSHTKISALKVLRMNGVCTLADISPVIYDLICSPSIEKEAEEADSIEEWKNVLIYANNSALTDLDEQDQNTAIECILREQIERFGKPSEYLDTWSRFLKEEVM